MNIHSITDISLWAIPVLLSVTFHEAAHAWMAAKQGDDTALLMGRLSFNPLCHVHPFGTIILPLILYFSSAGFLFGFAKPVPVNFRKARNFRQGILLISLAGPVSNLMLAIASAILLKILWTPQVGTGFIIAFLVQLLQNMTVLNIILFLFNMIPIPPLDGGKVLGALLPPAYGRYLFALERYSMFILIAIIMLSVTLRGTVFDPLLWLIKIPLTFFLSIMGLY